MFHSGSLFYRTLPLHDSSRILAVKLAAYNREVGAVKEWYKQEHMNHEIISGERSKWWVWNAALDVSKKSVSQIQTYLKRVADGECQRESLLFTQTKHTLCLCLVML